MNELLKKILEALKTNGVELDEEKAGGLSSLLQTEVDAIVKRENAGLEKNKNKLLEDYRKLKTKFGDEEEFERLKKMADLFEQNEEMQLIAEGKHEEVFENRMAKQRKQWETAISTKDNELSELQKVVEGLKQEKTKMVLGSKIKEVASKTAGFRKDDQGAIEILEMIMSKDYSLNDDGELVYTPDPERISKAGKPFTVEDYMAEDFIPKYGKMVMDEVPGGAGVKDESNPFYRHNTTKNLSQMNPQTRDNMSDAEWIAARREQMKKD